MSVWTSTRLRISLMCGSLLLLLSGCSWDIDSSDTSKIPGPDPGRPLPADALQPYGPQAAEPDQLWQLILFLATIIGTLILVGMLLIMVRFRDRGETNPPKQLHGNTMVELIWTAIPAIILAVIAVPTVKTIFSTQSAPAENALHVTVVGKQYWWQFNYPDNGNFYTAGEMYIPVGREVYLTLDGTTGQKPANEGKYVVNDASSIDRKSTNYSDVAHSFWVPSLAGKRDHIPGTIRHLKIQADVPGVYPGNCAEFCGLSHANMRFTVIAVSEEEFEQWTKEQSLPAEAAEGELAQEGERIFAQQCVGCHNVEGLAETTGSRLGPDLTHFASRQAFAGYIWDTPYHEDADPKAEEYLRAWLKNAPEVKPGSQMPALHMSDEEIDAMLAYLATLE